MGRGVKRECRQGKRMKRKVLEREKEDNGRRGRDRQGGEKIEGRKKKKKKDQVSRRGSEGGR